MKLSDILLASLVAAIWGFNFVVIHVGINSFPPLMFSALRFILAAFPLILFLPRPDVSWKIILGIGMVLGVIKFGFLFIGMDAGLSAGLASLVLQAQAFFTVILAAFIYKERPAIGQILGIIIAFSGIGLVATTVDANATLVGLVLVLIAPFSLLVPVFGMVSSAAFLGEQFGPTRLAAVALVIGGLVLTVLKPKMLGLTSPQNSDRER